MTANRDTDVQEALRTRGFTLSADEVKKVEINYMRLRSIYDRICDWEPPTENKAGVKT